MNRGNRGEVILGSDTDYRRFLGHPAELPEQFRTVIHALVLIDNRYHHLLRHTRDANLNEVIRNLKVSFVGRLRRALG